jgi:hypothetical protein
MSLYSVGQLDMCVVSELLYAPGVYFAWLGGYHLCYVCVLKAAVCA